MPRVMITPMEDFCGKIIFENEMVRRHFISAVLKIPVEKIVETKILDFDYLKTSSYHSVFRLRDMEGNEYSDALEIHIIELGKLNREKEDYVQGQKLEEKEQDKQTLAVDEYEREVEDWIAFFRCKTEKEVENLKLHTKNPGIKEAIAELMSINASTVWRARHEEKLKEKRDRVAREEFLMDKGITQGITKGRENEIFNSVYEKDYSLERGAEKLNLSKEIFEERYQKWLTDRMRVK